jgi:glycosyltransferase involved in cell wall biosynthesis
MNLPYNNTYRIVVNANPLLGNLTGVGQVTAEISRRLSLSETFDVDHFTPLKTFSGFEEVGRKSFSLFCLRAAKAVFRRLPFKEALRDISSQIGHADCTYDLYWEPNFIPLDSIAARRVVTTIHDMSSIEHPEWHPKDRIDFFSKNFFSNIGRSDIVVAVSQFTRARFLESQSEVSPDRVRVIPCGINHDRFRVMDPEQVEMFRRHHRLPESFVLFVGSIEPRKNLENLLIAYDRFPPARRAACPLVLVGDVGWENREIHRRIKQPGSGVRTFGYFKNPADLALMYNAATVFVYPSLYEGFGIPPLEAMACGTPVCLSSIPVFHEIYGPDTACYADPFDPDALAEALLHLLDDAASRQQFVNNGLHLAQTYTWDRVYEQYAELFKEVSGR